MVIMDALLCIIHKTHCMHLLIDGVNNMQLLLLTLRSSLETVTGEQFSSGKALQLVQQFLQDKKSSANSGL